MAGPGTVTITSEMLLAFDGQGWKRAEDDEGNPLWINIQQIQKKRENDGDIEYRINFLYQTSTEEISEPPVEELAGIDWDSEDPLADLEGVDLDDLFFR